MVYYGKNWRSFIMKKLVSLVALVGLTATSAMAAAPVRVKRNVAVDNSMRNVAAGRSVRSNGTWYMGGRLDLNLLSWDNEYSTQPEVGVADPKESFAEMLLGGNVFVGHKFNSVWRAELEAGMISQFEDSDDGFGFKMSVPYVMANGYYDFSNGWYVGAGLGVAFPETQLDNHQFVSGTRSERAVSPMLGLMGGWSYRMSYNMLLDLRYRMAFMWGTDQERVFKDGTVVEGSGTDLSGVAFKNSIGMILDNSFSIGLRYEF